MVRQEARWEAQGEGYRRPTVEAASRLIDRLASPRDGGDPYLKVKLERGFGLSPSEHVEALTAPAPCSEVGADLAFFIKQSR